LEGGGGIYTRGTRLTSRVEGLRFVLKVIRFEHRATGNLSQVPCRLGHNGLVFSLGQPQSLAFRCQRLSSVMKDPRRVPVWFPSAAANSATHECAAWRAAAGYRAQYRAQIRVRCFLQRYSSAVVVRHQTGRRHYCCHCLNLALLAARLLHCRCPHCPRRPRYPLRRSSWTPAGPRLGLVRVSRRVRPARRNAFHMCSFRAPRLAKSVTDGACLSQVARQ
jgi:hypothetical protein